MTNRVINPRRQEETTEFLMSTSAGQLGLKYPELSWRTIAAIVFENNKNVYPDGRTVGETDIVINAARAVKLAQARA